MTIAELEQRVLALERELAEVKSNLTKKPSRESALATFGAFADDPGFEEMVRLGREYREKVNRESLQ